VWGCPQAQPKIALNATLRNLTALRIVVAPSRFIGVEIAASIVAQLMRLTTGG
jgi:hypothetical protein